jgi:Tol biopolymer transport system component
MRRGAGLVAYVLALATVIGGCSSAASNGRPSQPSAAPPSESVGSPSAAPTSAGALPSTAPNPFVGDPAWIAYWAGGVGLIHPDGTGDHHIGEDFDPGELALPNWSPDGSRLVTTTFYPEDAQSKELLLPHLYEYDLATEAVAELFDCGDECLREDDYPAYSPDGSKVVFVRRLPPLVYSEARGTEVPSDCGLWIGDIASGEASQITRNSDCDEETFPRWSPDGSRIAYWRDPYSNGQPTGTAVFTINIDGTDEQRLTDPAMFAGDPDWSPDGEWIVFSTYPLMEFNLVPEVSNLYRIHPDGSGMEQLTNFGVDQLRATQPRYTPDGKWIIFIADIPADGQYDRPFRHIWAIPADGGTPVVIADEERIYTHATWQP